MALEGFTIRADGGDIRIESPTGRGALYGCFRLLSLLQRGRLRPEDLPNLALSDTPDAPVRMWQMWDNLAGTIERGYGGRSVFHWDELPTVARPRYREYFRLLASVGINAVSVNNVNTCDAPNLLLLTDDYASKLAVLSGIAAEFGIAVRIPSLPPLVLRFAGSG